MPSVNFFEKCIAFLSAEMSTPQLFGWFHLLWVFIVIALCFLVIFTRKWWTQSRVNTAMGITSVLLIGLEAYKQLSFSYTLSTDSWAYSWYAFPFQFCSTPMYVMALAPWLKAGKLRRALCAYLATYALFAGLVVMVYPGDVFIATIGVNIQTMAHHGAMVVIGVLLFASKTVSTHKKTIVYALPVFCVLSALALFANVVFYHITDGAYSFNMFFISPYEVPTLVVFDKLYAYLPYPFYLLAYIFGFTFAAFLVLLVSSLIYQKNTHGEYYENNRNRNRRI